MIESLQDELNGIADFHGSKFGSSIHIPGIKSRGGGRGVAVKAVRKIVRTSQSAHDGLLPK